MTRVLVAGAGGAIGVHVVAELVEATDWEITAIAGRGRVQAIRRIEALGLTSERVTWLTADLATWQTWDRTWLATELTPPDYIINLAAASDVRAITANPVAPVLGNLAITMQLLEFARRVQAKAFLQLSSHEVYGPTWSEEGHREYVRHRPPNPYAASKAAADDLCFAWWRAYGVPVILANTVNNFGETQRADKLPVVLQRAIMAGEPVVFRGYPLATRQWVHSRDTGRALRLILESGPPAEYGPIGGVLMPTSFNIGGELLSGMDVAHRIADILRRPLILADHDPLAAAPVDAHYGLNDTLLRMSGAAVSPWGADDQWFRTVAWQADHPEWMVQDA